MALAASSPPASALNSVDISMSAALDDEIAQVRAEIAKLTQQRKLLTSSLLSSTKVQSRLFGSSSYTTTAPRDNNTTPLNVSDVQQHSQSNTHRLAFGVTSFPFTDPSPELQSKNPLLGVRIDICNRHGKFDSPYYIFCIRAGDKGEELRIHRHTIPALVPLEEYERKYLPLSSPSPDDEGYGGSDDSRLGNDADIGKGAKKQDLQGLVATVRYDLVSWRLRQDAAEWLRAELGLSHSSNSSGSKDRDGDAENHNLENPDRQRRREGSASDSENEEDEDDSSPDTEMDDGSEAEEPTGKFNIHSLTALEVDARQLRIIWSDDRVGRLKISDDGKIQKAVVIGEDGNREGDVARQLMGDGKESVSVYELLGRLERVYKKDMGIAEADDLPEQERQNGKRKRNS